MMRLVCPSCGAIASMEAWANDANWRAFAEALTKLPKDIEVRALPYLGLFRKGERGLTPPRARKLLAELLDLVASGTVRWDAGEERPAPTEVWARAMDAVLARRPQGLDNHNYLRRVAWESAKELAAQAERDRERAKLHREHVSSPGEAPASDEDRAEMTRMLKEFSGKMGGAK